MYNDTLFVDSVFNGLTDEGVVSTFGKAHYCLVFYDLLFLPSIFFACLQFVVQMGKSKMNSDPSDEIGRFKDTGLMVS